MSPQHVRLHIAPKVQYTEGYVVQEALASAALIMNDGEFVPFGILVVRENHLLNNISRGRTGRERAEQRHLSISQGATFPRKIITS